MSFQKVLKDKWKRKHRKAKKREKDIKISQDI